MAAQADPRLGGTWMLAPSLAVRAGWGYYYLAPNLASRFERQIEWNLFETIRLEPEQAVHYLAGSEWRLSPGYTVKLEGYHKQLDDLVVATAFDGLDSRILVPDHPALRLGDTPFTLGFWIRLSDRVTSVRGDVLSKFDAGRRRSLTCRIAGSSPGYSSVADAILGEWIDHGEPWPSNTLISALTVFRGEIYTGIADALPGEETPTVFRLHGGSDWVYCGTLNVDPRTRSVMAMVVHGGALYAGTGTWDWGKSIAGNCGPTHVFRYEGDTCWRDCGQLLDPA